jgi:dUTP pyrophosphatase
MNVKIKKLNDKAVMPQWNNKSAGCDLFSTEEYIILPGERHLFKTGLSMAIPNGLYGRIAPRSGLAYKYGFDVMAGVIDEDYRGEIGVILINLGDASISVMEGDKIAQLIFEKCHRYEFEWADNLDETTRGAGGYGSTDKPSPPKPPYGTPVPMEFRLLGQTTIEKAFRNPNEISSVQSYLRNFQGELYLYEENGKRGICIIDSSGAVQTKYPL